MRIFGRIKNFLSEKKLIILLSILNVLIVISVSFLSYAYYDDYVRASTFLPGFKLGGVQVGRRSFSDSTRLLAARLEQPLRKPFVMKWGASSSAYMPVADLVDVDAKSMVRHGVYIQKILPIWMRAYHRILSNPLDVDVPLNMSYDCSKLQTRLTAIARKVFIPARDATAAVSPERVRVIPSKKGQRLNFDFAWRSAIEMIPTKKHALKLKLDPIEPKIKEKDIGRIITIDKGGHTLRLFNGSKKIKEFPIACGSPSYPTPTGHFKIVEKRYYPTWTNPHMGWSAGMPEYIPPGRGNPLGTRAMDLDASGIRIHGTPSPWSIGSSVSHGCIRMYISDAEDLFDRVEVGTPVYIFY